MNHNPSKAQWYSLAIVVFAADQAAKTGIDMTTPLGWSREVTSFFNLVHVLNPGAAFSFLAGAGGWQRWFFLAIALVASAWLVWLLSRPLQKLEGLSYSLILGGALGNAFDRAVRGQVVDYLDFHLRGWHWPAFNIADMAIVGGAIALVVVSLLSAEKPTATKASRPVIPLTASIFVADSWACHAKASLSSDWSDASVDAADAMKHKASADSLLIFLVYQIYQRFNGLRYINRYNIA